MAAKKSTIYMDKQAVFMMTAFLFCFGKVKVFLCSLGRLATASPKARTRKLVPAKTTKSAEG